MDLNGIPTVTADIVDTVRDGTDAIHPGRSPIGSYDWSQAIEWPRAAWIGEMSGQPKASSEAIGNAPLWQSVRDSLPPFVLDTQRAVFAGNIAAATILASYFAFIVNLENTFWALLTLPFVLQAQSGLTVWRSVGRIMGTVLGACVGLIFFAVFAQNGIAIMMALALWIMAMGILGRFQVGADSYGYGIAGVTALVIVLDTGPDATQAFALAVARATETAIPIVVGLMIILVVFPNSIIPMLKGNIATARTKVNEIARLSVALDDEPHPALRREVAQALRTAFTNLRARRFEIASDPGSLPRLRAQTHRLDETIAAGEALNFVLDAYRGGRTVPPKVADARARLARLIDDLPDAETTAGAARDHSRRMRDYAEGLGIEHEATALDRAPSADAVEEVSALFRMRELASSISSYLEAEAAVLDPDMAFTGLRACRTRHFDPVDAVQIGGRAAIAFFALSMFWLASAWDAARILTLVVTILALQIPANAPRAALPGAGLSIGKGILAMFPVVLLLMVVLPKMETFFGYSVVIGAVMFVFFYIAGKPQTISIAYGAVIMLAIGLQPSNLQVYSPIRAISVAATLTMVPAAFTVMITVLFPGTPARLRARLTGGTDILLGKAGKDTLSRREFLAQNIDLLADYGGDLPMDDPINRHFIERTRATALAGAEIYDLRATDAATLVPYAARHLMAAATAASHRTADEDPRDEIAEVTKVSDKARDRLATASTADRMVLHRLLMATELLTALIVQRRLSLPGAAP